MTLEKPRRRSQRLHDYDYSQAGAYFVTACTQGRVCRFGSIANGEMGLNDAGRMIESVLYSLPDRFPNVEFDAHVVMPNHVHAIILLSDSRLRRGESCILPGGEGDHKDRHYAPSAARGTQRGSLGRVIQALKSLTTNAYIRGVKLHGWPPFPGRLWQRNYYEHVIRNENDLFNTQQYIENNPLRWDMDDENPDRSLGGR